MQQQQEYQSGQSQLGLQQPMQQQQEDDEEDTTGAYCEDDEQYSADETGSVMNCSLEWSTGLGPPPIDSRTGFRGSNA